MKLNYGVVGFGPRCKGVALCIRGKGKLLAGYDPAPKSQNQLNKLNAEVCLGCHHERIALGHHERATVGYDKAMVLGRTA